MSNNFIQFASISKKVTMGIAGLFLILFLLVHLGLNLLLLRPDGGEWFRSASHFMGSNYIVKVFEIVLILAFLIHMLMGVLLWLQNRLARPRKYFRTNRSDTAFMSKYMFHTGVVVLTFLVIHFLNFYFVKLGIVSPPEGIDSHDFYTMAGMLFSNTTYTVIYLVALLVLGIHLNHAFQSAFQTLGLNHNKYYTLLKRAALVYAVVVAGGFMLIPFYYLFII
ncbi:MAG: succinate dehydrogenase cytochrome b subunit [Bacteroidales bacterium]